MTHPFHALGKAALTGLAEALASGRIVCPVGRAALEPHVPEGELDAVYHALAELHAEGMLPRHIARLLRLLIDERSAAQRMTDRIQLVWSPPDFDAIDARDTAVVVQELFRRAQSFVLISTYGLDDNKWKAEALFGELAARMDLDPTLSVRLFANIKREFHDETPSSTLVSAFSQRLRAGWWPGQRLPEVYYDPRSLETEANKRAVLHAKAVVVDGRWTLLTSANFTEAAQERNIEAGVIIDDAELAKRVARQFDQLLDRGVLRRAV